jgi:hypothetical protein
MIEIMRCPLAHDCDQGRRLNTMQMTDMPMAMMWGIGLIWLLVIIFLLLGIAAFIKYLRSSRGLTDFFSRMRGSRPRAQGWRVSDTARDPAMLKAVKRGERRPFCARSPQLPVHSDKNREGQVTALETRVRFDCLKY